MEVGFIEGIVGVDWGIVVVVHWGMLVDRLHVLKVDMEVGVH